MAGEINLSGIDSSSAASALFDQLTSSNIVRENQVDALLRENSSLENLSTLLLNVASSLQNFTSYASGASAKAATSSSTDVLSAAADSNAQAGTYTVNVLSLATSAFGSFGRGFAAADELLLSDSKKDKKLEGGSLTFTVGTGESSQSFSVAIDKSTTAESFVAAFNEAAGDSASASLVNVGTESVPDYRIVISASKLGTEKGSLAVDDTSDLLDGALGGVTIQDARNAKLTVSGISGTIERSSNTIDDVISGVTIRLSSVGQSTVSVEEDSTVAANQIEAFVNAYNSLVEFFNKEDRITSTQKNGETTNIYGSLASTEVDDNAVAALRNALFEARSSDGLTLASFGVSTNQDGTLNFDREAFEKGMEENAEALSEIQTKLADSISTTRGIVHQFAGYGGLIDSTIKGNESEMSNIEETISRVESTAASQSESMLKNFQSLELLLQRLSLDGQLIQQLLQF